MNEIRLIFYWLLRNEFSEISKLRKIMHYITLKTTQFYLLTTIILLKNLHGRCIQFWQSDTNFLRLPEFRQTPNFALYNPLLRTFTYVTFKIFFVCGWFVLQGIEKGWLGRNQRKKWGWTTQFSHLPDSSLMLRYPCNCLQQKTHTFLSL